MKNGFFRWAPVALMSVLAACGGGNGGSTAPPANVTAKSGDGWIQVNWDATAGIEYWVFTARDAALTTLNWLNLAGSAAFVKVTPPLTLCAQTNDVQRWFTVNSRTGSGAGGPGSPLVSVTPRAAGGAWTAGAALGDDLAALGFGLISNCARAGLATGVLTAVGPAAAIHSSGDAGATWMRRAAPAGFIADLYAVANYTANPGVTAAPGMRTIAVGAGGAALVSTDASVTWTVGRDFDAASPALRGIVSVGSSFYAVGDGGAIRSTTDGSTWSTATSNTGAHLRAIVYGNGRYIAAGDGGTLVTSTNGGLNWSAQTIAGAGNLRAIAYGSNNNNADNGGTILINTFVAVADNGSAVVSNDGGATWSVVAIAGAGELAGIAYISRFVAVDRNGNAFVSANGRSWSSAVATGRSGLRAIATNGYGYSAAGDGGVTASSF